MSLSGFTFLRNTSKLYYPIAESIQSILPIVDEFVVALGDSDPDDETETLLESIGSTKIKVIHTTWDLEKYPRGMEHAHQTDIAKEACQGDWLFYLQGDEVVHEEDFDRILDHCDRYLADDRVEGFLFQYLHFYGDYNHYFSNHCWYPREIRIVRNVREIHSFESAQSFRRIPDFDGVSYRDKEGTHKLHVVDNGARIFHYGWVRPPKLMIKKNVNLAINHHGKKEAEHRYAAYSENFDYGRLDRAETYTQSHPAVMKEWMERFDWDDQLRFSGPTAIGRPLLKHETSKYRAIMWIEKHLLGGRMLGGYRNYELID